MIEIITAWAINYGLVTAGSTVAAFLVGWVLKKIPTDRFAKWAEKIGKAQGLAITTFFNAKLPRLYNGVIEPVFISTIHALIFAWWGGFKKGLETDN